jgi:hypothetical protein
VPDVALEDANLIPEQFVIAGIGGRPIDHGTQGKSFEAASPFLSVQQPATQLGAGSVFLPGAPEIAKQGRSVGVGNTVAVVRDDDTAQPAELIVLQVHGNRGCVGIQPIPNEFSDRSNRLSLGLPF